MQPDFFESSTISQILSWASTFGMFLGAISILGLALDKYDNVPRILSIWIGLCIVFLSPLAYMIFQAILAMSYLMQSFSAFFLGGLISTVLVPVYGLICLVIIGGPIFTATILMNNQVKVTFGRGVLVGIITPIVTVIFSSIFYFGLSYAGNLVGWMLNPKDLVKATNGPAAVFYKYAASPLIPKLLPNLYTETPQRDIDLLRCHVAGTYLNDKKFGYFVKYQYPEIYEKGPR